MTPFAIAIRQTLQAHGVGWDDGNRYPSIPIWIICLITLEWIAHAYLAYTMQRIRQCDSLSYSNWLHSSTNSQCLYASAELTTTMVVDSVVTFVSCTILFLGSVSSLQPFFFAILLCKSPNVYIIKCVSIQWYSYCNWSRETYYMQWSCYHLLGNFLTTAHCHIPRHVRTNSCAQRHTQHGTYIE